MTGLSTLNISFNRIQIIEETKDLSLLLNFLSLEEFYFGCKNFLPRREKCLNIFLPGRKI
jgi:hypothetical protein